MSDSLTAKLPGNLETSLVDILDREIVINEGTTPSYRNSGEKRTLRGIINVALDRAKTEGRSELATTDFGLMSSSYFERLVKDIAAENNIPFEKVLPLVLSEMGYEIMHEMPENGEMIASAFGEKLKNSFESWDRFERAWKAAEIGGPQSFTDLLRGEGVAIADPTYNSELDGKFELPEGNKQLTS